MNDKERRRQEKYEAASEHYMLKLLARTASAIGIPLAGFLFWQMWGGLDAVKADVTEIAKSVAVVVSEGEERDRRLNALERFLWTGSSSNRSD